MTAAPAASMGRAARGAAQMRMGERLCARCERPARLGISHNGEPICFDCCVRLADQSRGAA